MLQANFHRFFQCLNEVESGSGGENDVAVGLCLADLGGLLLLQFVVMLSVCYHQFNAYLLSGPVAVRAAKRLSTSLNSVCKSLPA